MYNIQKRLNQRRRGCNTAKSKKQGMHHRSKKKRMQHSKIKIGCSTVKSKKKRTQHGEKKGNIYIYIYI